WELVKLNTEEYPDIAGQYGVRSIPNVKLFVDGNVREEFSGALPEYLLEEWLKKNVPSPYEKEIAAAGNFINSAEPSKAQALLQGVLHKEPGNLKALSLLSGLELFSNPREAIRLCSIFEIEPVYSEFAGTIATLGRLLLIDSSSLQEGPEKEGYLLAIDKLKKQDFNGALEGFIGVLRENRQYDDDGSRKACIAIFRFLGEEHEITMKHRRSFDRAF
ncbi:MAG: tetratricopeptide repeat protein, partial [Chlorobiaceae bacterium]|nr:tetratricopeptide repeat protein [Chlorobiaceae bacterium]